MARLGVASTAGALCQASQRQASTDLVAVHHELIRRANSSPVLVMDETGWRVGGAPAWLWEATNAELTLYWVARGRGFDQACEVVEAGYAGTIVRDGWAPYRRYEKAKHQTCIGHLLRRCHEMDQDLPNWARPLPRRAKTLLLDALAARDLAPEARPAARCARLLPLLVHRQDRCPAAGPFGPFWSIVPVGGRDVGRGGAFIPASARRSTLGPAMVGSSCRGRRR